MVDVHYGSEQAKVYTDKFLLLNVKITEQDSNIIHLLNDFIIDISITIM